ncbi:MAG TPA: c-type cytochrome [Thermoanaerobaculia bacterium]|nr:c-type cytochrome [Thermoanaerobaculia bacterium]
MLNERIKVGRAFIACAGLLIAIAATGCQGTSNVDAAKASPANAVERGKYLVTISGCNDCHTPMKMGANGPEPDTAHLLAGHPSEMAMPPAPAAQGPWLWSGAATNTAFAGPWGVSYSANLTPDKETGIGIWKEEQFIKAMRTGKHWGEGRPILPPMPWQGIAAMSDGDLKAVFAYLQSVPPVRNSVPNAVLAPAPGAPAGGGQ